MQIVEGQLPIIVHDLPYAPDMAVGGKLLYLPEANCLTVEVDRGKRMARAVPVWPKGSRPLRQEGRWGVLVPSFGAVLEGDIITAGGDVWNTDDSRARDLPVPAGCDGGFIVFNPDSFREPASD